MLFGLIIIEGIVMCFLLLITLVIGIANGPVGMAIMYEKDVQERVIEKGLTTREKMKKTFIITLIALYLPVFVLAPSMAYFINGARGFIDIFWQSSVISLIMGVFDRFFIDWYWVGKTKTWDIIGTEDLKPYIPKKALVVKWFGTVIGLPLMCAVSSLVFMLF